MRRLVHYSSDRSLRAFSIKKITSSLLLVEKIKSTEVVRRQDCHKENWPHYQELICLSMKPEDENIVMELSLYRVWSNTFKYIRNILIIAFKLS